MNTPVVFALVLVAALAAIPLAALALVLTQWPDESASGEKTLDFASVVPPQEVSMPLLHVTAADGAELGYRYFPARRADAPLVILIHGSGWHGGGYQWLAREIAAGGDVAVAVPDLRGHGPAPQRRGDVAYIGQLEDDIAGLAKALRKPGQALILAGHSSGGGLVVRFAGGRHGSMIDGAILLSPYLRYDAPTMRDNAGGWTRVLTRRVIGLSILNALGIHALDGLTAVTFRFPQSVLQGPQGRTATTHYSWRLNQSYAPRRDYLTDIARLPPFLLIAGTNDEAFRADRFEPVLSSVHNGGKYRLLDGVDHLGLINNREAARLSRRHALAVAGIDPAGD